MPNLEKLPGLENIISDGGLAIPPKNPLLNGSILIIGFANNGPVNTPVVINDPGTAFATTRDNAIAGNALFGNMTASAQLGRKYYEALKANVTGNSDIRVMRLGLPTVTNDDTKARGDGRTSGFLRIGGTNAIRLVGKWAGNLYDSVTATTTTTTLTLSYGGALGSVSQSTFTHSDYNSLVEYVDAINLSDASAYLIAEVVENDISAETTVTASGASTSVSQAITRVTQIDLVQQIAPTITGGTGLQGVDNVTVDSLLKFSGTRETFSRGKFEAGPGSYQAYTGAISGSPAIVGASVFVPKYVFNEVSQYVSGGNNPFPVSLPLGALTSEAGTSEATKMASDYSNVTQTGTQMHNTILGGLRVSSLDTVTSATQAFAATATDPYLVTNDGAGTHDVTIGIPALTNSRGVSGDTDYVAATDNSFPLHNIAGAFNALIVNTPGGQQLPGGFYIGVGEANDAGTPAAPAIYYWDYGIATPAWVAVGTVTDGTTNLTVSGFLSIALTGAMEKAAAVGSGMRWAIVQNALTAATAGKINSIIPVHPESYGRPVHYSARGNFSDININVAWGSGKTNQAGLKLSAPLTWGTKPGLGTIGTMAVNDGWVYGNVSTIVTAALYQPTIVTFKIPANKTITTMVSSYYQNVEATSTGYGPNLDNLLIYDSGIDGNVTIEAAEEARRFGFSDATAFGSDIISNGGIGDVWGTGYIVVPRAPESANDFFNFVTGTVETTNKTYETNYWRVKYLTTGVSGTTLDTTTGNLGLNGNLNGQAGNDYSGLSIAEKRQALKAALNLIDGYEADIYVLSQMFLDDTYEDENGQVIGAAFHEILHDFLLKTIKRNHESVGVLSVKPFDLHSRSLSAVDVARHYNNLTSTSAGGNSAANIMEAFDAQYGCVSVVAGEPAFNNNGVQYFGTGEAAYAGLMSSIPVADGTTNKAIRGTNGLRYSFLREQHEGIMRHRYALLGRKSAGDGVLVIDGVTAARNSGVNDRSDFVRISTVRVVFELLQAVRAVAEPYIGRPNAPWSHNQLKFDVQKVIDDFRDANYIVDGSAQVQANLADRVNGNVFITLSVVPPLEIRRIIVSTSLRPSLEG